MTMYLSGASNPHLQEIAKITPNLGIMLNPESRYQPQIVRDYSQFAIDNGCFSQGDAFKLDSWLRYIDVFGEMSHKCLFVVAPDRFDPCGMWQGITIASATLERSIPVFSQIRQRGFKAALVAQNGLEDLDIPWNEFDVLFIGGDTTWKLSPMAVQIVRAAKSRGKWVHMGRVNSQKRFTTAENMGCDSVDGTYIKYGPNKNTENIIKWIRG